MWYRIPHAGIQQALDHVDLSARTIPASSKTVATADVFVENYRPGAFEALGPVTRRWRL